MLYVDVRFRTCSLPVNIKYRANLGVLVYSSTKKHIDFLRK